MKYLILIFTVLTFASCTDEFQDIQPRSEEIVELTLNEKEHESAVVYNSIEFLGFEYLPETGFMSEFIQSMEKDINNDILASCDCGDLLIAQ